MARAYYKDELLLTTRIKALSLAIILLKKRAGRIKNQEDKFILETSAEILQKMQLELFTEREKLV